MASKSIVLITGANTGIGYEVVKALLRSERPYHVLLAGRSLDKAKVAAKSAAAEVRSQSSIEPLQLDVESDESIQKAFEQVSSKHPKVDTLVNNAGAAFDSYAQNGEMTLRQAYNRAYDVNVTGTHIATSTFLPLLLKSNDPRLLFVTSGLSSLADASDTENPRYQSPPAGLPKQWGATGYQVSKTGLNMLMVQWARMLAKDRVKVWALAPGLLATGLGGDPELLKRVGAGDPSAGGIAICGVIEGKRDADEGKIVREYRSPIQPW